MSRTPYAARRWRKLDQTGWFLWGAAFTLLLALAVTLPSVYLPLRAADGAADALLPEGGWVMGGLVALVALFCAYTVSQQRELNRMRAELERDALEQEDMTARLSEILALFHVTSHLHMPIGADLMFEIVVRRIAPTLRAQRVTMLSFDPEARELVVRAAHGLEAGLAHGARVRAGEGLAGRAAAAREVQWERTAGGGSALALPLVLVERVVGVLVVERIEAAEPFGAHHAGALRPFGEHLASAIERAFEIERLGERARVLEADNRKLAELHRMKDVFLSTASHELKTPLSSVIAYAELLDDHEGRLSREQSRDFVGRLRGEAMRLMGLIEDILDLSRLESGKMRMNVRGVTLAEVASGAIETTRMLAKRHEVTLAAELDEPLPALDVDEIKIRQVVVNLLVNAVRHSPAGGTVRVRTRADGAFVRLEVADQGPGVPAGEAMHIFELFGQAAGENPDRRGALGIGLHLVKRLTELHGGHTGVTSNPDGGSTFYVRLPVPEAARAEDGSEAQAA